MKITITLNDLKLMNKGFGKVVANKSCLPVLTCVLFRHEDGLLTATATGLDETPTPTGGSHLRQETTARRHQRHAIPNGRDSPHGVVGVHPITIGSATAYTLSNDPSGMKI